MAPPLRARPITSLCLGVCLLMGACASKTREAGGTATDALRLPTDPWAEGASSPSCPPPPRDGAVTLDRLLSEMVDLAHLTRLPDPPYTSHFVSSHDPASDGATPDDDAWFANRDFFELEAGETRELLNVSGPGALTRMWSATPAGTLRIYLDGSEEPAIEAPMRELLRGDVAPMEAPYGFVAAGGHNLYFPIPFSEGCRITVSVDDATRLFFHASYRSYAPGTEVESFDAAALDARACMLELVAERLSGLSPRLPAVTGGELEVERASLDAQGDADALELVAAPGGSMIWELRLRPVSTEHAALRGTLLRIDFDDAQTVLVPLATFFAAGRELRTLASAPIGAHAGEGELVARWPMPFAERARIAALAPADSSTPFELEVTHGAHAFTDATLLFHAGFRAPETFPSKPPSDWMLADIEGDGLYVGNVLDVVNSNGSWWGEGDEKIYIDGETFPSHFGTGTEDYFGYAWCSNATFDTPYVGQPLSSSHRSFGPSTLYRFHVLDPLRFTRSLRFDMEVRHWGDPVDVTYDAVSLWYARPGSRARGMAGAADDAYGPLPMPPGPPRDLAEGAYTCGG